MTDPLDQATLEAVARVRDDLFALDGADVVCFPVEVILTILDALPPIPTVTDNKGVGRKGG